MFLSTFIESLRLHPPLAFLSKTCTERHVLESTNPEYAPLKVTIEPDTPMILPVMGLQLDPKYFPEPEKFIPERFSKDNSYSYVYLPFGVGPRACIGQRFGLLQIKIGLAQLIKKFKISINEKTPSQVDYLPFYFLLFPKGGIWLDFKKI
ncbi:hypothetical protein NQ317_012514 [Molorchus minor]|uniref:Cytochrome P450 n=1 Tax=Molorchus minor TaxID=1323400 RepID=A0ABQ9K2D0_9CUCU|nr:hypothetical protein NQ317_012514 [Molorchus minor]